MIEPHAGYAEQFGGDPAEPLAEHELAQHRLFQPHHLAAAECQAMVAAETRNQPAFQMLGELHDDAGAEYVLEFHIAVASKSLDGRRR